MKDDGQFKHYLFDLGRLVKECALAAVAEKEQQTDQPALYFPQSLARSVQVGSLTLAARHSRDDMIGF